MEIVACDERPLQPSCEHGRYSRLAGTGHVHDDHNDVRKSLPPRAVICSPARALLCIAFPASLAIVATTGTATTSDPVPFVSTPIMCAGDRDCEDALLVALSRCRPHAEQ